MKQILLATHNKAKLGELKLGTKELENNNWKVLSLHDVNIHQDPEETGKTFEENAILKAKFYAYLSGIPTIADDGGLMIPFLNNDPGVKSKRWLGRDATDEELIQHTLLHLRGVKKIDRTAYLQTCLCYFNPLTNQVLTRIDRIKGHIALKKSGRPTEGYPYRALFVVEEFNKYYDELTDQEHHAINHRLKALRWLVDKILSGLVE